MYQVDQGAYWQAQVMFWGPKVLIALLILVATWAVARAVKWMLQKAIDKSPALRKHVTGTPEETVGHQLGTIAKLIIWLVGIMAALQFLGIGQILAPINRLTIEIFDFLPRLLGAGLIFFVGLIVARIVRRLVETVLIATNVDGLLAKIGVGSTDGTVRTSPDAVPPGAAPGATRASLARALGVLAFALIIIPVAIAALQVPGFLVLLTSRPNGMPVWIARCHAEVVAIQPLDDDSGLTMLADMLGPSAANDDLKNRIISHTANVPLFIEEVCRGLRDSGTLHGQWGDLALMRPIDELGIPSSIQGVIAARLDRVSRQERSVLQIAAALGPRSSVAMLRNLVELPESALQDCLAVLDRAELLVRIDSELDDTLEFRHEMVRQVTYDSMVEKVREDIHARILARLEND